MTIPRYLIGTQQPHIWLDQMLDEHGISNSELARKLKDLGHTTVNKATVGKWRTGFMPPQLSVLPSICVAFNLRPSEVDKLTLKAFKSAYPFLTKMIRRELPITC